MKKIECFKKTNDDWYPNYSGDRVRIFFTPLLDGVTYRVAVWGNDDFGLEMDGTDKEEMLSIFNFVKSLDRVDKAILIERGFTNA